MFSRGETEEEKFHDTSIFAEENNQALIIEIERSYDKPVMEVKPVTIPLRKAQKATYIEMSKTETSQYTRVDVLPRRIPAKGVISC